MREKKIVSLTYKFVYKAIVVVCVHPTLQQQQQQQRLIPLGGVGYMDQLPP